MVIVKGVDSKWPLWFYTLKKRTLFLEMLKTIQNISLSCSASTGKISKKKISDYIIGITGYDWTIWFTPAVVQDEMSVDMVQSALFHIAVCQSWGGIWRDMEGF